MQTKEPAKLILERSARNKQLAIELYCECYIYSHYYGSEEMKDTPPQYYSDRHETWLDNFVYRIRSILKDHRITVEIDTSDVRELYEHTDDIKKYAAL